MITLPPGFNYNAMIADLLAASLPFIDIMMLVLAYLMVKKGIDKL